MHCFAAYLGFDGRTTFASLPQAVRFGPSLVLFRGFIANRAALLTRANLVGDEDRAMSDCALIALAATWWGHRLSQHVTGEYAVIVVDLERDEAILAHDELGLMPLFYAATASGVAVATHLEDIVSETGPGSIDEIYVADWLMRAEHDGARTPYEHIRRLLPGESATWRQGRWTSHDVWTLGSTPTLPPSDTRDYAGGLRDLTLEAVATAVPPSKRVWCELSGGLDSSTVVMAAAQLGVSVETISFVYSQSRMAGEQRWIDIVLQACPVPSHSLDVDTFSPFSCLPSKFLAEPSAWLVNDAFDVAYTELLKDNDVEVVLTGEGGDAVFFGDKQHPFFLADALRTLDFKVLSRELGRWGAAAENRRSATHALVNFALLPLWNDARSHLLEHHSLAVPWLTGGFAQRMKVARRQQVGWRPKTDSIGSGYMLQRVMRGSGLISTHTHHRKATCQFRNPLLYRPLIEFMLAVPWKDKIAPGVTRPLQRRALKELLPAATLARMDKGGSDQPWYRGLDRGAVVRNALVENPRAVRRGWFDRDAWRTAVQHARVGSTVGLGQFRASAALELWLQQLELIPASGSRRLHRAARELLCQRG